MIQDVTWAGGLVPWAVLPPEKIVEESVSIEMIREQVESYMTKGEKISTSVEIPLSQMSKDVLKYAHEESENLQHRHIGTEHLLLGLLRHKESVAARDLGGSGLGLAEVRQQIKDDSEAA